MIRKALNAARIFGGLFVAENGKSPFSKIVQIVSRLTWQAPQTLLGFMIAQAVNLIGRDVDVIFWHGAVVTSKKATYPDYWQAFTLGCFITGDNITVAEDALKHEYGHYIQSRKFGPFYLFFFAVPSLISFIISRRGRKWKHDDFYTERNANEESGKYFDKPADNRYV